MTDINRDQRDDVGDRGRSRDERDTGDVTAEVASEGGSPGDVEIATDQTGTGSEAGETWRPATRERREIVTDETGEGRRSP
jgi:hypothetical protein